MPVKILTIPFVVFLAISPSFSIAGEKRAPSPAAVAYLGPIIDAHNHPHRKSSRIQEFFEQAEAANVANAVIMTTPNDYRKNSRELLRRSRSFSRAVVLCSANFAGFIHTGNLSLARRELGRVRDNLKNGVCKGLGEVGLRHYDKTAKTGGIGRGQPEVLIGLDHELVLEALKLADTYGIPVILHIEPVYSVKGIDNLSKVKDWYKRVCRQFPKAKLIAAHNGMMAPKDIEELFLACGNLFADFKFLHSKGAVAGFQDLHPLNGLDFKLFPHWIRMMSKYPDRFIFWVRLEVWTLGFVRRLCPPHQDRAQDTEGFGPNRSKKDSVRQCQARFFDQVKSRRADFPG